MYYSKSNEFLFSNSQEKTDEIREENLIATLPLKKQILFKQFRKEGWAEKMPAFELIDIVHERAHLYHENDLIKSYFGNEPQYPWQNTEVRTNNSNNQTDDSYFLNIPSQEPLTTDLPIQNSTDKLEETPFEIAKEPENPPSNKKRDESRLSDEFVVVDVKTPLERLTLLNTQYLTKKTELNALKPYETLFYTSTSAWKNAASQLRAHALIQCESWVNEFKDNSERVQFLEEALKLPIICGRTGCSSILGRDTPAYTHLFNLKNMYEDRIRVMNNTLSYFASLK